MRQDSDPAVSASGLAAWLRAAAVRQALAERSKSPSHQRHAEDRRLNGRKWRGTEGALFSLRTIDPGEAVVRERLAVDGVLSDPQCEQAVGRWYSG